MTLHDRLAALNRLQRSRWFKIVASAVVLLLAVAAFTTFLVSKSAIAYQGIATDVAAQPAPEPAIDLSTLSEEQRAEYESAKSEREAIKATEESVRAILSASAGSSAAGVGISICAILALGIIWLGHGLTVLAIQVLIAGVAWPLVVFGSPFLSGLGRFIGAASVLAIAFVVLMELLRLALSAAHPVTAIARNVVNEAVRMKVSLVFIVLLLLGLAVLPALLDESTPLRYRVQNFLSWGTGGTFWLIALLTVFLAVGTVAFEQRDRVVWQTMTKPVGAWQFLLGKWIGVVGVAAVLLGVSTSGVFLFTEYLRAQRAQGESEPYVARSGLITQDRLVLESQVLTARRTIGPVMPDVEPEVFRREVQRRSDLARQTDSEWRPTEDNLAKIAVDLRNELRTQYLTIEGGARQRYQFRIPTTVKAANLPVTLRYKVSVGADDPRQTLRLSFLFPNVSPVLQEIPLGQMMTLPISPASIEPDGTLRMEVINADVYAGADNTRTMSFPPDGISLAYPAGSYRANFARAVIIMWLKLAFLAMVGVVAATFLSFAVASLVSFGVFIIAEGTRYLATSLEYYGSVDEQGNLEPFKVLVRAIAVPISYAFRFYGDLTPTTDLVDGKVVEWIVVGRAVFIVALVAALLYAIGVWIFRSRELATYSGQ